MHTLDKKGVCQGRLGVGKLWAWIGQGVSEVWGGGGHSDCLGGYPLFILHLILECYLKNICFILS